MVLRNTLVAGSTCTGKTMTIKNILLEIMKKCDSKGLEFIIFDKKKNEYLDFEQTNYMNEKVFEEEKLFIEYLKNNKNNKRKIKIIVIEDFKYILDYLKDKEDDYNFFMSTFIHSSPFNIFILSTSIINVQVIRGLLKANSPIRIFTGSVSSLESNIILDDDCREEIKNIEDIVVKDVDCFLDNRNEKVPIIK